MFNVATLFLQILGKIHSEQYHCILKQSYNYIFINTTANVKCR